MAAASRRKITQPQDRKRLKAIAAELEVPEGMGLIIRTAGAARTKQEIKRDFEYLLRLWESVRDLTLQSQAPSLVYEEGNLIKRSIRDLYNKDVDEVIVAGGEAHREAKDFMRMLMPSHAKNVTAYQEPEPLFTRFQIERQLNAMFSPYVTLRSGGYLVINQTEALVAIDVNSGKATREFSIEETAHHTNLEAADEIARQLKLRDLAGLIVVDFIDMEEKRNNRAVERRLKEALRFDRARIQVGRISHFGLLEMSRQRLRTGVLEGSTTQCPHCQGTGIIRSTESVALAVLRGLEDTIMAGTRAPLIATTTPSVALYILNNKRPFINDMEARLGLQIMVTGSDKLAGANFTIEKGAAPAQAPRRIERNVVNMESGFEGEDENGEFEAREQPAAASRVEAVGARRDRGERERAAETRKARVAVAVAVAAARGREREEGNGRYADDNARSGNVEDVGGEDEAPDAHEQGGVEDPRRPDQRSTSMRPRERAAKKAKAASARASVADAAAGAVAAAAAADASATASVAARRGAEWRQRAATVGDDQPAFYSEGERRGGEATSGHREAIADFPNLPADGNEVLPAREVHRAQDEASRPRKEVPAAAVREAEPAAPRRAGAPARASRAWNASSSGSRSRSRPRMPPHRARPRARAGGSASSAASNLEPHGTNTKGRSTAPAFRMSG